MRMPIHRAVLLASLVVILVSVSALAQAPAAAQKPAPWLKAEKVADGTWRIDDNNSDNMYLVVGKDKALLIDTGTGVAQLRELVKTLTDKPVMVVNTHGHGDHAGGNYQFKSVYAHPADFEGVRQSSSQEARKRSSQHRAAQMKEAQEKGTAPPDLVPMEEFVKASEPELLPAKDGFVFDLGGRKIEVIETPGHTPGEIVLLDSANKQVFAGDNDNGLVWLFLRNSLPLETYLQSLRKLQGRVAEYATIYPGHGGPLPNTFVAEQIACVEGILNGTLPNEPYHSSAGDALLSKYKTAQVAYNPQNLRIKK